MARISKEKKEEIRKKILKISADSFFEKGYEKTSTKEIAKHVGIAEGTLFNYFETKADLYMEAFALEFQMNEEHLQALTPQENSADEVLSDFVNQMYSPLLIMPKFMIMEMFNVFFSIGKRNFTKFDRLAQLDFKYMDMTEQLVQKLIDHGLIQESVNAKLMADSIYGAILFEFAMYIYRKDMMKEELMNNINEKISFICKGYLT
jgi:AcrR family transcriptional regulator